MGRLTVAKVRSIDSRAGTATATSCTSMWRRADTRSKTSLRSCSLLSSQVSVEL